MEKIITGIILLFIIVALSAYLSSRSKSVEIVTRAAKEREDEAQAKEDEAQRRRMVHEADSGPCADLEPFCGAGQHKPESVQKRNAAMREEIMGRWPEPIKLTAEQERRARSRAAVARAQAAARASMKP